LFFRNSTSHRPSVRPFSALWPSLRRRPSSSSASGPGERQRQQQQQRLPNERRRSRQPPGGRGWRPWRWPSGLGPRRRQRLHRPTFSKSRCVTQSPPTPLHHIYIFSIVFSIYQSHFFTSHFQFTFFIV